MSKRRTLCQRAYDGESIWLRTRRIKMRDGDKIVPSLPNMCLQHMAYNRGYKVERYSDNYKKALVKFGRY